MLFRVPPCARLPWPWVSCLLDVYSLYIMERHHPACPPCVSATQPASFVRLHPQLKGHGVYNCASLLFFTWPTPSAEKLRTSYEGHVAWAAAGRANLSTHDPVRARNQFRYFQNAGMDISHSESALVVEAGCNDAALLSMFGRPGRTLVCFEPVGTFSTYRRLSSKRGAHA